MIKIIGYKAINDINDDNIKEIDNIIKVSNPFSDEILLNIKKRLENEQLKNKTRRHGGSTIKQKPPKQYKYSTHKRTKKRKS